jgi:hypothetical protein
MIMRWPLRELLGLAASTWIHALLVSVPTAPRRAPRAVSSDWQQLTLVTVEATRTAPLATEEPGAGRADHEPISGLPQQSPRPRHTARAARERDPAALQPPIARADRSHSGIAPSASAADLSPRRAARSVTEPALDASQRRPCDPGRESCGSSDDADDLESELQSGLQLDATTIPHLAPRDPPRLRRKTDGTYAYRGHVFAATIRPDGSVAFEDRTPLFSFDLTDIVEKHILGKQLYTAEKLWFLEQTAGLRAQLEQEERRESIARAERRLKARLLHVLRRPVDTQQIQRAIFELWEECADDETGWAGQRIIEAFVREQLPEGSQWAYSHATLDALNARRSHRRAFAPYASD